MINQHTLIQLDLLQLIKKFKSGPTQPGAHLQIFKVLLTFRHIHTAQWGCNDIAVIIKCLKEKHPSKAGREIKSHDVI